MTKIDRRKKASKTKSHRFYADAKMTIEAFAEADRRTFSQVLDILVDEGIKVAKTTGLFNKKKHTSRENSQNLYVEKRARLRREKLTGK